MSGSIHSALPAHHTAPGGVSPHARETYNPALTTPGMGAPPPHFGAGTPQPGVAGGALYGAHNPTHTQTQEDPARAAEKAAAQAKYETELAAYNQHVNTKMDDILRNTIADIAHGGAHTSPLLDDAAIAGGAYQPMAKAYSSMPHAHVLKLLEEFKASPSLPVAPPSSVDDATTTTAAPELETQALDHLISAIKNISKEDWNKAEIDADAASLSDIQKHQLLTHVNAHIVHRNMVGMHADLTEDQKKLIGNDHQAMFSAFITQSGSLASNNVIAEPNTVADALLAHQQLFQKRRAYLLLKDFLIPQQSSTPVPTPNESDDMEHFVTEMSNPDFDIHKKIDQKKLSVKRQALIAANKDNMVSYFTQYEPSMRLYQIMLQWLQALQAQAAAKTAPTDLIVGLQTLTNTLKGLIPEGDITTETQEKIKPILGDINCILDMYAGHSNVEAKSAAQYQTMVQELSNLLKDSNINLDAYGHLKALPTQDPPTIEPNLVEQLKGLTASLQGLIPEEGISAETVIQPILSKINDLLGKYKIEPGANDASATQYQIMLQELNNMLKSNHINVPGYQNLQGFMSTQQH